MRNDLPAIRAQLPRSDCMTSVTQQLANVACYIPDLMAEVEELRAKVARQDAARADLSADIVRHLAEIARLKREVGRG
jgi:hypothetical protein